MRKTTCEQCVTLSRRRLTLAGVMRGSALHSATVEWPGGACLAAEPITTEEGGTALRLGYMTGDPPEWITYAVPLTTYQPHFGGASWWLHCPKCGRRGFKLYLPPRARVFACRGCHNLTYGSCQESHCWDGSDNYMAKVMNRAGHRTADGRPYTPEDMARIFASHRKQLRGRPMIPE